MISSFIIGTDGKVSDIKIEKTLGEACDKVVMGVIEKMNSMEEGWTPGQKDGKAVKTILNLPVKFKLSDDDKKELGLKIEQLKLIDFRAAPNPTNGQVNLSFRAEEAQPIDLQLISLSGKTFLNKTIGDFDGQLNLNLDLTQYPKGAYVIRITQGNKVYNDRIIVQ